MCVSVCVLHVMLVYAFAFVLGAVAFVLGAVADADADAAGADADADADGINEPFYAPVLGCAL